MGAFATFSASAPSRVDLLKPNTIYNEPTGYILPHILLCAAQFFALLCPPFRGRNALFSATIFLLVIWSHFNAHFTNDPSAAQPFALLWPNYMGVVEKLLFSGPGGPESAYWRIDRPPREAMEYAAFSWKKLRWAAVLVTNLRGVRWNWEVKNVSKLQPKHRHPQNRQRFLIDKLCLTAYYFLAADIVNQLWIHIFYTPRGGYPGMLDSKYLTLRDEDWRWRIAKSWLWGQLPYLFINFQYAIGSVVFVGLGISAPEDWPPIFGPLSAATSVRNFWGVFWQQIGRRVFSIYPQQLLRFLRIRRGTLLSSYGQIWAGFALSAFFHAQINRIAVSPANITFDEKIWGVVYFFLWQAAAITVEDFAIWGWKQGIRPKKAKGRNESKEGEINHEPSVRWNWKNVIGYTWVCWNFYISMPFAADVLLRMRTAVDPMLPISVARPFVETLIENIRRFDGE